jgi:predicted metal-binding protein
MTKIGIIRCQELAIGQSDKRCAGWNCFPAMREKTKYMDEYDTIELVGFDTCGGCPGRNRFDKIIERGMKLKEKGAEVIHISTCIALFCPNKDKFVEVLKKKTGLPIKEKTHTRPDGEEFKPGQMTKYGAVGGEAPAKASKKPVVKKNPAKKKTVKK